MRKKKRNKKDENQANKMPKRKLKSKVYYYVFTEIVRRTEILK